MFRVYPNYALENSKAFHVRREKLKQQSTIFQRRTQSTKTQSVWIRSTIKERILSIETSWGDCEV